MDLPTHRVTVSLREARLLHQHYQPSQEVPEVSNARAMEEGKTYILNTSKELQRQFTDQAEKTRQQLEGADRQSTQYSKGITEFVRARLQWITQQYTERILLNREGHTMLLGEIERVIGEAERYAKDAEKVRNTVRAAPTEVIGRPAETPPVADNTHPDLQARETIDDVWNQLTQMKRSSLSRRKAYQQARLQEDGPLMASTREQYMRSLMDEREYIMRKRESFPALVSGKATNRLYDIHREIEHAGTLEEKRECYLPELQRDFASIDQHLRLITDPSLSPEHRKQALREADRARGLLRSSVKLIRELELETKFQTDLEKYERLKTLIPPPSSI